MFYMKSGGKRRYIHDTNTFTRCGRCGKELQVDLGDAVIDGSLDLYGTTFFCPECSKMLKTAERNCEEF